ncbi:MAG: purine-nucleoside phosphorylase [Oscillospiraceae bacterium]|nr:purine-nucleoside phosphorylase [Oscillospiraceae bacterium]
MSEFKGTPHNTAKVGEIAKTVLMPGDPLRAKFIADNFLENVKQFNNVRGMLGFTGTYKGKEVSVMGSGMGIPSIAIYSYELFNFYGVENIIRIGSAGTSQPDVKILDVVLADKAYSRSSFALDAFGYEENLFDPSPVINEALKKAAEEAGKKIHIGAIASGDAFYSDPSIERPEPPVKIVAGEMESFALFANARYLGKNAACIVTVSDNNVTHEAISAEARQVALRDMMEIALNAAITL